MPTQFTLVIPTYNESCIIHETISTVRDAFAAHCPCPWRIIVADNASTDHTADLVDALNDPRVSIIRLKEKGRGRAIREAFRAAGGGVVAFTDADLPIRPLAILHGLQMILSGECEVVVGTRFASRDHVSQRSFLRNGISMVFIFLAKMITGLQASDSQCPLKIVSERATPIMLATRDPTWWSELEFLLLVERLHIPMRELPVVWENRYPTRKSTALIVRDGLKAIRTLFQIRSYLPAQLRELQKSLNQR